MPLLETVDAPTGTRIPAYLLVESPGTGLLGGLVTAFIRNEYPEVPVNAAQWSDPETVRVSSDASERQMVVFAWDPDVKAVARLATTGVHSIVTLGSSLGELRTAMEWMLQGGLPFLSPSLVRMLAMSSLRGESSNVGASLTPRETEIIRLLALGFSNQEMASDLCISPNTVRAHLQAISTKLGVTGRTRVIARVRELGL